jgi:hypothetical protein
MFNLHRYSRPLIIVAGALEIISARMACKKIRESLFRIEVKAFPQFDFITS